MGGRYAILVLLPTMNRAPRPVYCHLESRLPVPPGCRLSYFPVVADGLARGVTSLLKTPSSQPESSSASALGHAARATVKRLPLRLTLFLTLFLLL